MATVTTCDKCKEVIAAGNSRSVALELPPVPAETYDLCRNCHRRLKHWITQAPPQAETNA